MKIGFIGGGNMAGAMIGGIIKKEIFAADEIMVSDANADSLGKITEQFRVTGTRNNEEVAKQSEVLVLAVKPQFYEVVIKQLKDSVKKEQLIVTIAPGKTLKWVEEIFENEIKIVRCMPNTPALIGEGITAVCRNERVTDEELAHICNILSACGQTEVLAENLMDAVVAVSGSSPAYVFMFIEAMADAAVSDGMPRAQAYKFASQAILGSAKMVLETGKHPGELKDMVCSPGGTTKIGRAHV